MFRQEGAEMKKRLAIFLWAALLLVLSLIFDSQFLILIETLKNPVTNAFFSWLMFLEQELIFYPSVIIATLLLLILTKRKQKIFPYITGLITVIVLTFLLKAIISRPRPNLSSDDSFPSGHASLLFASLPFFRKTKVLQTIWIIVSCLFVLARVWQGIHYLSDIIAGLILGYCIPVLILHIFKQKGKKKRDKKEDIKKRKSKKKHKTRGTR